LHLHYEPVLEPEVLGGDFKRLKTFMLEFVLYFSGLFMSEMCYNSHSCWWADGSIASVNKRKGSPCKQDGDDDCQADKMMKFSIPGLLEV
jgi:hypothetical protein